jgi:UDP-N-acetylmuramate--alanine ligase
MDFPQIKDYVGKKVHIIGISGASLCGLAELLRERGYTVTGSDRAENIFTPYLRKMGLDFTIGHDEKNVVGADLVVYSGAVSDKNVELAYARAQGIPVMERAVLLGQLMKAYPVAIGIAGCHGKTTITSMIGKIFVDSGLDATIHVGGVLDYLGGGGTRVGSNDIFLTEACEYLDSFLHFSPTIAVINNIDDDHLDYFTGGLEQIYQSFKKFSALVPSDGAVFCCGDEQPVRRLMDETKRDCVTYGLQPGNDFTAADISFDGCGCASFTVMHRGEALGRVSLAIPGDYNIVNALAAISVCLHLGLDFEDIASSLSGYHSAERRFQFHGTVDGVKVYHDFAHHPSAVKACLRAARHFQFNKLWVVFQCNSFSRAKKLFDKFVESFDEADSVIIAEIFPGREVDTGIIHGRDMAQAIAARGKEAVYIATFEEIHDYLKPRWKEGDMVLMVGSGNINQHVWKILI